MLPLAKSQLQVMYEILLQQLNGQVFDANGRIAIDSPQSRRVLELIRKMLDAGICTDVETFTHDYLAGFNADTIATYPLAVWLGGTIKDTTGEYGSMKTEWRVLRIPAFERGGLRVSNLGGSTLAIPDQCENKEAAWAFIEYALCTREGQVAQYANFDLFPAFLPALKDPFFEQGDAFYSGQKVRQLFATDVDRIPVLNRTSDWVETNIYLGQSFSAWAVEHADTDEMLKTLAGKLHRRLGRELVEGAAR